jgi:tRNA threonylcarbamoyladenosine biosynthesis protein TsaE
MQVIKIESLSAIFSAADSFLKMTQGYKKFAFTGELGSGKTTFINALCRQLGVANVVNSPTFALVNEYYTTSGENIYHFDFYRIKNIEEVYDLGYEEYFYSDAWCFIEWAEKVEELLTDEFMRVQIEVTNGSRLLKFGTISGN